MKKPTKPLSIRIPLELKEELQTIADKEYRPLATQIVKILNEYVKHYKGKTNSFNKDYVLTKEKEL